MIKGIIKSVASACYETPMVRLSRILKTEGAEGEIIVKLEFITPSGSLKDRIAYRIIMEGIKSGRLKRGMTIIEATSGNTGIAVAMVGASLGFPVKIIMPEEMSLERRRIIEAYGAELILTPGCGSDIELAVKKLKEIVSKNPDKYFVVSQFDNYLNPTIHYETTAPEIWDQTNGELDAFVQGVGTGGSLSGIAKFLKEKNPSIKVFAVEPEEAPAISRGKGGKHSIEGIGDGFIPPNLNLELLDGVITVNSKEAIETARDLARLEGIACGPSSGANVKACLKLLKERSDIRKVVTLINDSALRYFSTSLFEDLF